jgi:Tfp pilus assembly protein PilX
VRRLLRQEDGIALLMALGIMLVLTISTIATVSYTTSGQTAARQSAGSVRAQQYAESGLNVAYSTINYQLAITNGNPSRANLLGCNGLTGANDINGPSNCTTPTPMLVCFTTSCTAGNDGSARVYGYYSGTNAQTFQGKSIPSATWVLVSTGYARNSGKVSSKTLTATVKITPLSNGGVASVWNHIFITAPYDPAANPQTCSASFSGNNTDLTSPMYVVGNLCLTGQNVHIKQAVGGQAIDLQVGGKLVLSGSGTSVGDFATNPVTPITSGVVVGGCTAVSVTSVTGSCVTGGYQYKATTLDTFVQNDAPSQTTADMLNDWQTFDPGPNHTCLSGNHPNAPLADSVFDNDTASQLATEPNRTAASFELVPTTAYSCVSKNGSGVGQLLWSPTSSGSCGCGTLTVNGSIFIDGNLTISRSATYTGTGIIEVAGTITFNNNTTTLCATNPCSFTTWQGSSGNTSMLTLATLVPGNTAAVYLNGQSQTFQGSIWTQPTSGMSFAGNGATVEGPISIGGFGSGTNNATFKPLPIIKNMPVGAPVPPNTSASVGPLITTK